MFDNEEGECSDEGPMEATPMKRTVHQNNIWNQPAHQWDNQSFVSNARDQNHYQNEKQGQWSHTNDENYHEPFERTNQFFPQQSRGRGRFQNTDGGHGRFQNKDGGHGRFQNTEGGRGRFQNNRGDFRNQFTQGYEQYLKDDKFEKYYCDRCERGFKYQNQLDEHNREHVQCNLDGCTFFGHPKIVQKHIEMQHASGLASKVMGINTPEDIEKWKAERKRNFPTSGNIADKKAAQAEKRKRGEVLSRPRPTLGNRKGQDQRYNPTERRFESKDQPRNQDAKKRKRNNKKPKIEKVKLTNPFEYKDGQSDDERRQAKLTDDENEDMNGKLPRFTGTSSWLRQTAERVAPVDVNEIHISDEEEEGPVKEGGGSASALGGLTSLMCAYGSESDEGPLIAPSVDEKPATSLAENLPTSSASVVPNPQPVNALTRQPLAKNGPQHAKKQNHESQRPPAASIRPQRLTLLQKLLENEIRHERNVLLQCVYYTLENKFFDEKQ